MLSAAWLCALQVRKVTCGSLSSLGRLTAEVVELIVTPSHSNGAESAGSGTEGGLHAKLDTEFDAELAAKAQQELVTLQQCKIPALLMAPS